MTTSLRVLTYNVQMRSWAMEAGAQGSLTPVTSVESRAKTIAARILASPQQYDVVCLQEVFDEDGRDILEDELSAAYPHYIKKSDGKGMSVVTGPAFGVAGISALVPGGAAVAAVAGVIGLISLAFSTFEDSGLMLFSKLPFDTMALDPAFLEKLAENGVNLPPTLPATAFKVFSDTAGEDGFAAKGVLYARLLRPDRRPLHLLTSHTQADSTAEVGAHNGTRRKQFEQAFNLLGDMGVNVREAEVLFCGDLNIDGRKHKDGYHQEWRDMFDAPGTHFTDQLLDAWTREQCPGDPGAGRTPLPSDFDRGMTAHLQRLDYAIRARGPSQDRLLLQHMCIAYDIATDPVNPTAYTSDHLPLRIDLNEDRPNASVLTAEPLPADLNGQPQVIPRGGDVVADGVLNEGQMHWYRISAPGGYRIELSQGAPRIRLDVYTADNLSVPVGPYTMVDEGPAQDSPGRSRFVLPSAPFFLRVSMPGRLDREFYRLRVHRYGGTGPNDAIPLLRGFAEPGEAKLMAPHTLDDPGTPFSEHDAVWFAAPFDTEADGSLHVTSTVTVSSGSRAFGLLVLGRTQGGGFERMDEQPAGGEVTATVAYDRPLAGYILVRREDPTFQAERFTITLRSDVSYLYGNPMNPLSRAGATATLFCRDETNGAFGSEWGSDDIQVNVGVNGRTRVHIPNSDDLEFDDDSKRELPQVDVVRYTGSAEFELVELDDLSPVDRASIAIPQFGAVFGTDAMIAGNAAGAVVKLSVIFDPADDEDDDDDGIYDLTVTVSAEPPGQA
jgi:endonuclease/exonuclease/phosphatase family metal-dependent hydrolase